MKLARVFIKEHISYSNSQHIIYGYYAAVEPYACTWDSPICFYYETNYFKNIQEAEQEARAFCRWKKLKIRKIIREYKK